MPKDSDTIRLQKLAKERSELKSRLSIVETEYEALKLKMDERQRLELDLKLEQDCHVWYLRKLVNSDIIRTGIKPSQSPEELIEYLVESGKSKRFEFLHNDNSVFLTEKATTQTKRYFRNFLGKNNELRPTKEVTFISPSAETLSQTYKIRLNFKAFEKEFLANPKIGDLTMEFFQQFSPAILSQETKKEIKSEMEPHYLKIDVALQERSEK